VQLKLSGADDKSGIFPELKLLIFVMSFAKMMFFVRIFEKLGFLINMVKYCLIELIPFLIAFVTLIFVLSISYFILQAEIDEEVEDMGVDLNYFELLLLQTFRTIIGEIAQPIYEKLMKEDATFSRSMKMYTIWVIWYSQQFVCLIIMMNFIIAVITTTYAKYEVYQKTITYKNKAELNMEFFELMNLFGKYK
jgi:hypothetical protein